MRGVLCEKCGEIHTRCKGHAKGTMRPERAGKPCMNFPMKDQEVCAKHGGKVKRTQKAAVRRRQARIAEQAVLTLGLKVNTTPTEALLDEVQWTAGHVAWLREQVQALNTGDLTYGTTRKDVTNKPGGRELKVTEQAAQSIWYQLYVSERTHLIRVCAAAINAGVEERKVQLAERQGDMVAEAIRAILDELHLTPAQLKLVPTIVPAQLRRIAGSTT